ncbi:MAG: ATP-binding cassette domain-containing protein [Actinobacteria bacterium]|nr:ATP-binding cassette domain-containing protein [Actinomycetota bacterium]
MMTGAGGTVLRCEGVSRRFDDAVALDGFNLQVQEGDLLALLGPSGCGKTTALRVMAGFERPSAGEVWVGERRVAGPNTWVAPEGRRIGMVFQDWALFPHLDVWHNVAFGLADGPDERVREVLEMVHLTGLERRMPHELSGGQQQRVALARALAPGPEVILLDEPFSNLDATLRARVRAEVREVLKEAKVTAVFVTHDQEEALSMADVLAVMDNGKILQVGTPHEVYGAPATRSIAAMVGEANFLTGTVDSGKVVTQLGLIPAPGLADGPVEIMVRPESVTVAKDSEGTATIVAVEFYGHDQLVRAEFEDGNVVEVRLLGPRPDLHIGAPVTVSLCAPAHLFRLDDHKSLFPFCGLDRVKASS